MAQSLHERYRVSQRRACTTLQLARSTFLYRSHRDPQTALRMRMRELAEVRVHYGYRRLAILLRREGWHVGQNRVYRLYRQEMLAIRRRRPRRHVTARVRAEAPASTAPNQTWAMDFLSDTLCDGRALRVLTVVDHFSRESLVVEAGRSFTGERVARILERVGIQRGLPKAIRVDNGPEFTSRALDQWAYLSGIELVFSRPGKPTDNALIEAFHARLRAEGLDQNWFLSLEDAQKKLHAWRTDYNTVRPHSSLGNLAPLEFVKQRQLTSVR